MDISHPIGEAVADKHAVVSLDVGSHNVRLRITSALFAEDPTRSSDNASTPTIDTHMLTADLEFLRSNFHVVEDYYPQVTDSCANADALHEALKTFKPKFYAGRVDEPTRVALVAFLVIWLCARIPEDLKDQFEELDGTVEPVLVHLAVNYPSDTAGAKRWLGCIHEAMDVAATAQAASLAHVPRYAWQVFSESFANFRYSLSGFGATEKTVKALRTIITRNERAAANDDSDDDDQGWPGHAFILNCDAGGSSVDRMLAAAVPNAGPGGGLHYLTIKADFSDIGGHFFQYRLTQVLFTRMFAVSSKPRFVVDKKELTWEAFAPKLAEMTNNSKPETLSDIVKTAVAAKAQHIMESADLKQRSTTRAPKPYRLQVNDPKRPKVNFAVLIFQEDYLAALKATVGPGQQQQQQQQQPHHAAASMYDRVVSAFNGLDFIPVAQRMLDRLALFYGPDVKAPRVSLDDLVVFVDGSFGKAINDILCREIKDAEEQPPSTGAQQPLLAQLRRPQIQNPDMKRRDQASVSLACVSGLHIKQLSPQEDLMPYYVFSRVKSDRTIYFVQVHNEASGVFYTSPMSFTYCHEVKAKTLKGQLPTLHFNGKRVHSIEDMRACFRQAYPERDAEEDELSVMVKLCVARPPPHKQPMEHKTLGRCFVAELPADTIVHDMEVPMGFGEYYEAELQVFDRPQRPVPSCNLKTAIRGNAIWLWHEFDKTGITGASLEALRRLEAQPIIILPEQMCNAETAPVPAEAAAHAPADAAATHQRVVTVTALAAGCAHAVPEGGSMTRLSSQLAQVVASAIGGRSGKKRARGLGSGSPLGEAPSLCESEEAAAAAGPRRQGKVRREVKALRRSSVQI